MVDRRLLAWHRDLPSWSAEPPAPLFDLVHRAVMEDGAVHPVHSQRIPRADLSVPIDVMEHHRRLCVLDGIHRLAKSAMAPMAQMVTVRSIRRDRIPVIRRDPT